MQTFLSADQNEEVAVFREDVVVRVGGEALRLTKPEFDALYQQMQRAHHVVNP